MNDPISLTETDDEDRHEIPDTNAPGTPGAPGAPGTQPVRTLLDTAATCRPLEEVTALVSLLKETGRLPNRGHEALRTAAVTRPVHEVREMIALLGESPHEVTEADITLRAAAVGRPVEDVALLVTIPGAEEPDVSDVSDVSDGSHGSHGSADPAERAESAERAHSVAPEGRAGAAEPVPRARPRQEPHEEPSAPPHHAPYGSPYEKPRRRTGPEAEPAGSGSPVLRHVLRWPVALALLVSGALHLPKDLAALRSAPPAALLPLLVTVLCLGLGALLALRDTAVVWRAGAAAAVGVVGVHVVGGVAGFDPLAGAVGGSLAWAGVVVVLCAAAAAVLAGLALRNRQEGPA
ncbi:hypothetical protein ACFCZ1_08265 [Streptomyces sp. NPDC056224]|uniref:hypothetical protein n=1 Tax=Streptomyces sp. NPDC056224 TaxID=3345750 RepID=UPI0035DD00CC